MSQNHRHEPQDVRIERLLRDRQPTGNRALDDLAGTTPRANPAFQQQLEDRLLDTLQTRRLEEERRAVMMVTGYIDISKSRWSIPLTLVAAMIAVVLGGTVLFSLGGRPSSIGSLAQSSTTPAARESLEPLFLTATSVVRGATEAQAAVLTAVVTSTPIPITGGGTDDAIYLTATHIVQAATATQRAALTASALEVFPTPTPISYIGVVTISGDTQANVRAEPSFSADVLERLSTGTLLEVIGQNGDWLNIRMEDGREGWIAASLVQPSNAANAVQPDISPTPIIATVLPATVVPPTSTIYGIIMPPVGDGTGVLREPQNTADASNIVTVLKTGTIVVVMGQRPDGQWLLIRGYGMDAGIEGWVIAEAVEFQAAPIFSLATPEVVEAQVAPIAVAAYQPVVIALQDMPRGTTIERRAMLAVVYWPTEILPEGIFTDPASLVGYVVAEDVAQWQPVLSSALAERNPNVDLSAVIPSGKVAVALPFDVAQAPALQDGDTVDIYLSLLFVNVDERFQEVAITPAPTVDPELASQRAVDDALIVHVGAVGVEAEIEETLDVITVAVSPEDAEVLTWAVEARLPIAFLPGDVNDVNVRFGESISLLGFTAQAEADHLGMTLYWHTPPFEGEDIQVFVHVTNEAGELIAQQDSSLMEGGVTTHELVFNRPLEPEGVYTVGVGLYRASDGSRVPITTSDPRVADNTILLYAFSPD